MFDLFDVARLGDTSVAEDAYGVEPSFMCQLRRLEMFKISGVKVRVRELSYAPGVVIPSRNVIKLAGRTYLVGSPTEDLWEGEVIRHKAVILGATNSIRCLSVFDAIECLHYDDYDDFPAYFAEIAFNVRREDSRDDALSHLEYQITLGEDVLPEEHIAIDLSGNVYFTHVSRHSVSGLYEVLASKLRDPFQYVEISRVSFDPVEEVETLVTERHPCLVLRWQEHFKYLTRASEDFVRGDQIVLVRDRTVLGSRLTISGREWEVVSYIEYDEYFSLHVRPTGR